MQGCHRSGLTDDPLPALFALIIRVTLILYPAFALMTTEYDFAISRRIASDVCIFVAPLKTYIAH